MLAHGVAERAGQRRDATVDGDRPTSGRELFTDPGGDVVMGQLLEPDRPEGGGEVLVM